MKQRKYNELTALKGKLREEKITYRVLSERTGISLNTLNSKINGYSIFDLNEADKIINEAHIKPIEIIRYFFPSMLRKETIN